MTPPRATYRLQLHRDFGFDDVARIAPYLAQLGISHVYTSPFLKARPGSMHGYDIVAHDELNPELGGAAGYLRMIEALHANDLKLIIDFVPNHMGVGGSDNPLWLDVLEWGSESRYAGWFDIEWEPHNRYLVGKVLVPFLSNQYGVELEANQLVLKFDVERGEFAVWAYDTHKLPICPLNYADILGDGTAELETLGDDFSSLNEWRPQVVRRANELKQQLAQLVNGDPIAAEEVNAAVLRFNAQHQLNTARPALDALIQQQNWRATHFRVAGDDINYRRFFNVNDLAGLRIELPDVFEHTHQLLLQLIHRGDVDGLRIDHIDGLIDPAGYLNKLREVSIAAATNPLSAGPALTNGLYLVVEKILQGDEQLSAQWPVDGTTGYEFCNLVLRLLIDPRGESRLTEGYQRFIGRAQPFEQVVLDSKVRMMDNEMAGELNVLARAAARVARSTPRTADFTAGILRRAICALIACLPVYRTYLDSKAELSEADAQALQSAIAAARTRDREIDDSVFDFLERLLNGRLTGARSGFIRHKVLRCAMRLQQYSGPVMAKGLEDTAFYRFNRFIALNEVGGNPDCFGGDVTAWHQANLLRLKQWPHSMLSTSTHDTKRGEDTRARLAVLSELADEWLQHAQEWQTSLLRAANVSATEVDANDLYMVLQMLVGSFPAEIVDEAPALQKFRERLSAAVRKSLREAKVHTTWHRADEAYEAKLLSLVDAALQPRRHPDFWQSFLPFVQRVAALGVHNTLVQVTLKLTAPGVPDIYQGNESWNLSMVDPDNRRAVDYATLSTSLANLAPSLREDAQARTALIERCLEHWHDGRIKLLITHALLAFRRSNAALFSDGDYQALTVLGDYADEVCAFARCWQASIVVVIATRFPVRHEQRAGWGSTRIVLPALSAVRTVNDVIGGRTISVAEEIALSQVLGKLPVAVLTWSD